MAAKSKERAFHALSMRRSLTLTGGYSGKHFVPQTRDFEFTREETAAGAVELKECVAISHKEAWLCEIATGQPKCQRPLARVRIVRELTQLLGGDAVEVDKKMAALAFDSDDSDDAHETPKKAPAGPRKRNTKNTPAVAGVATCKAVEVQEQPSPRSKKILVYAALDKSRRLWLDVNALPWLIQYIKEEKASGGLDPVEDAPSSTVVERRIYWNFRDNNWIARAQAVDGTWLQATRGIKRKQKASELDFEEAKQAAFGELEDWVAKVAAGEITKKSDESGE